MDVVLGRARSAQRSALPRRTSFPGLISTCHHPLAILLAATEQGHVAIVELYSVVIGIDSYPLIFAVHTYIIDIDRDPVDAIGGQAGLIGILAVRCARFHHGYYWDAGPHLSDYRLQRLHHFRLQGGGWNSFGFSASVLRIAVVADVTNSDLGIVEDLDKLLANLFLRMA